MNSKVSVDGGVDEGFGNEEEEGDNEVGNGMENCDNEEEFVYIDLFCGNREDDSLDK